MINFDGSMKEGELKTSMVKNVRVHGGYARRFEDRYAVGLPDTIFIPVGIPVIIAEVKIVEGFKFAPTDRQYVELERINEHNPRAYGILIGWKDAYYFSESKAQTDIRDCFSVTTRNMSFHDQLVQFYFGRLKK